AASGEAALGRSADVAAASVPALGLERGVPRTGCRGVRSARGDELRLGPLPPARLRLARPPAGSAPHPCGGARQSALPRPAGSTHVQLGRPLPSSLGGVPPW